MILMQKLREERRWSQRELWRRSGVDPHYLSLAERQGMRLFPGQAVRVAEALEWKDDPMELFDEVEE